MGSLLQDPVGSKAHSKAQHSEKRVSEGRRVRIGLSLGCDRGPVCTMEGGKKPGVGELSLWDGH